MQSFIEDLVRLVGWVLLKLITVGKYKSDGRSSLLFEGTVGLLVMAAAVWIVYQLWPA
jgi:hypothetical protein